MSSPLKLPGHILRRISVEADCDPRSVRRAVEGEPVRPSILERITRAMQREGLPRPLSADLGGDGVPGASPSGKGRAA